MNSSMYIFIYLSFNLSIIMSTYTYFPYAVLPVITMENPFAVLLSAEVEVKVRTDVEEALNIFNM